MVQNFQPPHTHPVDVLTLESAPSPVCSVDVALLAIISCTLPKKPGLALPTPMVSIAPLPIEYYPPGSGLAVAVEPVTMNSLKLVVNLILPLQHPTEGDEDAPVDTVVVAVEPANDEPITPPATKSSLIALLVVMVILFFPNYLVVQPILFGWWLLSHLWTPLLKRTTPLVIYEEPTLDPTQPPSRILLPSPQPIVEVSPEASPESSPQVLPAGGREPQLHHLSPQDIADSVKLPLLLLQKYMFPPPLRLFPLSRNPERRKQKKKLILDLDETLIHSLLRGLPRLALGGPKMIEIQLNGVASLYYVYKRPHVDYFLSEISKWFELQVFTALVQEYADPIIDWLEQAIRGKKRSPRDEPVFTKRYYRHHCSLRKGVGYVKDLSKFFPADELKLVVILDNSPVLYALHEDNAIMIEGWINDQHDRDLLNLLPMLRSLLLCIDVRFILGLKKGQKRFEG